MDNIQKFKLWLSAPIGGQVLGIFRIAFGLFMAFEAWVYYRMGLIENGLLAPKILFKFDGLGWIPTLPKPAMLAILALMGIGGLLIALGIFFRWACWIFSLSLAFIFFQEKSYYNNHIYLFILLGVLLSFTHADRFYTLNKKSPLAAVPRWQQFMLQLQFMIVYFYGGIAKIKTDWLFHQEPVTSLVKSFPPGSLFASVFQTDLSIYILTYCGFLIDILAPVLLWYKPVRRWALIPFAVFHLTNSQIFDDIGIFPFVMLTALILYFEPDEIPWLRKKNPGTGGTKKSGKEAAPVPVIPVWVKNVLLGYFAFQLLFPFRGFFLPNPMDWTYVGRNFSWRMKADTRPIEQLEFSVQNPVTGQILPVNVRSYINEMQVLNISYDARSALAFARLLRQEAARMGIPNAIVKARILVRYNGRPPQLFLDPNVDLASLEYSPFRRFEWVIPLNE